MKPLNSFSLLSRVVLTGISFGIWQLTAIIPPGQPFPGTYTIDITIVKSNGMLTGSGI